jgi:two-component system alkaline phosphatase synthesis response regulator PhoP
VLRRSSGASQENRLAYGSIQLDADRRSVRVDGTPVELTFKEFELLRYMLHNTQIVLSRDQLMNAVWGFDYEGESRTVDMHVKTLRQKLGPAGRYIKTVRHVGYKIGD